jgi:chromate transporter
MDEDSGAWPLAAYVLLLSTIAVGSGLIALTPELHRFVVDTHHWITSEQFVQSYTIAQIAPGPNFLFITLIGLQVAGWTGAIAVTVALALPSLVGTLAVLRFARGRGSPRLKRMLQQGLLPISIGMLVATSWLLLDSAGHDLRGIALAVGAAIVMGTTRINPLWMIALGALAGLAGLV